MRTTCVWLGLAIGFAACDIAPVDETETSAAGAPIEGAVPLQAVRQTYVMQATDSENISAATLAKADGIVIRTKWSTIEPQPGAYNLAFLKAQIARAKASGKKIQLEVLSGDDSPRWLETQGAKVFKFSGGQIPKPWDPIYQQRYALMIRHIAKNLDWSNVTHFHAPGADNAEWHYNQFDNGAFYAQADFTDAKMVSAHVNGVGELVARLPGVIIVCDIGDHARAWTATAIQTLKNKYRGRVGFQMDSLKATTKTTYDGFVRIADAAAEDHHAGFEMVGPSKGADGQPNDRFGGPLSSAIDKANQTDAQWLILYQFDL